MKQLFLLFSIFLLSGCQPTAHDFQLYRLGTVISGKIYHHDAQGAEGAIAYINQRLATLETLWHPWRADSELATLSAACQNGHSYVPNADTQGLLTLGQQLQDQSLGYFNPEIGALVALWGFHADTLPETLPKTEALAAWQRDYTPGRHYNFSKKNQIFTCEKAVQFDFSAFAKGYALDLLAEELTQQGIRLALLNAGGNIKTLGQPSRPWFIGIRSPRGSGVSAGVTLYANESIATSGDYERYFMVDNRRYHHLLNPETAQPADYFQAVTVIAESAGLADAASTALFIAGENWLEVAKNLKLSWWLLYRNNGEVLVSPDMQQRLRWQVRPEKLTIVPLP
jgi:thiamine biosynthesis lipoprotein